MKFVENFIKVNLNIESSKFNSNMNHFILSSLQSKYEKKAFEQYGIIDSISSVERLIDVTITNSGSMLFIFEIKVNSYVPQVFDILEMKISKIISCGYFLEDLLIKCLVSEISTKKQVGDTISIVLTDIRFEKNAFHCLAKESPK